MKQKAFLELIKIQESHIKDLITLSTTVGWEYDEKEVKTLLSSGKVFGYVTKENTVIACAAIIPYETRLASIGMVIVHPEYRGLGLAKGLVQTCMNQVSDGTTIMLIATEEGLPVYQKLRFKEYSYVSKLVCPYFSKQVENEDNKWNIQVMNQEDFQKIIEFDEKAFGDFRSSFLLNRFKQSSLAVVVKSSEGCIEGYAFAVQQPTHLVIGPIVATSDQLAWELVQKIASKAGGSLRIDLLEGQTILKEKLLQHDFHLVNEPPIMVKTKSSFPIRNNHLYAIAAQAYG